MRWQKRLKKDYREKLAAFREALENEGGASRKDTFAMVVSAFIVFLPVALLVLFVLAALLLIPMGSG